MMKKIILFSAITFSILSVFAQTTVDESSAIRQYATINQPTYTGVVMKTGDIWIIQVREYKETVTYVPLELPEIYQKERTIVQFSYELIDAPSIDRQLDKPIKLTAIKSVEEE